MEPFRACKLSGGFLQCPPTLPNSGRTRTCQQPCLTGTCSTLRLWCLLPAPSTPAHVLRVALEPAIMGHCSSSWMQLHGMLSSVHVVPTDSRFPCSDSRWLSEHHVFVGRGIPTNLHDHLLELPIIITITEQNYDPFHGYRKRESHDPNPSHRTFARTKSPFSTVIHFWSEFMIFKSFHYDPPPKKNSMQYLFS